jgi:hypothetical protein
LEGPRGNIVRPAAFWRGNVGLSNIRGVHRRMGGGPWRGAIRMDGSQKKIIDIFFGLATMIFVPFFFFC